MSGKMGNPPKNPGNKLGALVGKDEEADPSMEDILASIRKILSTDDQELGLDDEEETEVKQPEPVQAKSPSPQPTPGRPAGAPAHPALNLAGGAAQPAPAQPASAAKPAEEPEDILVLDDAMMIAENEAPKTGADNLVDPTTAAAASSSVGALKEALAKRNTTVSKGGSSLEDIIRDEFRPMLKTWLDSHLAAIVERLVRAEIERVVTRELS
jgi:cell pole-organizing protein PopZ